MKNRIVPAAILLVALAACDSGRPGAERGAAGGEEDPGVELKEAREVAASSETALEEAGEAIERDSKPEDPK